MKPIYVLAIVILLIALALGTASGLLIQSSQSPRQIFSFEPFAVRTSSPIECSLIPQNYTDWLGINVVGNRTAMSFSQVSVYATGENIRIDIPLNNTAFAEYKVTNSTFETIITPLPNYFDPGTVLTLAITYSIGLFAPTTVTLSETPIVPGSMKC